jgi:hypothetical protein
VWPLRLPLRDQIGEISRGFGGCRRSAPKDFGSCLLTGSSSSGGLTTTDLDSIGSVVSEELSAHDLSVLAAQARGVVSDASEYYRNTTPSLGALQSSYSWAEKIHDDAEDVMDELMAYSTSSGTTTYTYGLDGAASYYAMALIRQAMLLEMHNIEKAKIALGVAATNGEYLLNETDLKSFRVNRIQAEATEVATFLRTLSGLVDGEFSAVSQEKYDKSSGSVSGCMTWNNWLGTGTEGKVRYCFTGPNGKTCGESSTYRTCKYTGSYSDVASQARSEAQANFYLRQQKIAYREDKIGPDYFKALASFTDAGGGDFEYCGNGTCAIGEIDSCSEDCSGNYVSKSLTDFSPGVAKPSSNQWLLDAGDARLVWNTTGYLSVWNPSLGAAPWVTYSSYTTSDYRALQFANNILQITTYISPAPSVSGARWYADTGSNIPSKMILIENEKAFHLVDASNNSLWNSAEDPYYFARGSGQFCYSTSEAQTVLSNKKYSLAWQSDGNLVVYNGSTAQWASSTSGGGKYLCNQEDGTLAIYPDSSTSAIWSAGASTGSGGKLALVDDQLRLLSDRGGVLWVSSSCSTDNCKYDAKSTASFSLTKGTSDQTILQNGKAKLVYSSTGYLKVVNTSTGATVWTSSNSGTTASLAGGVIKVGSTSVNTNAGSSVYLADCNLFVGDATSNKAVYSTNTTCE